MFTTTDEEMQQIKQPMEFLIKRTNQQCKRCTSFSSNKAALNQRLREPPVKKEKCIHCGETINRANNLEKHLRSYEKTPTHPAKHQLRKWGSNNLINQQ